MADNASKFLDIIDERVRKVIDSISSKFIKQVIGEVLNYDKDTNLTCVKLINDIEEKEYIFYNKTGEELESGDQVRIFYTTNITRGWIDTKMGVSTLSKAPPSYISTTFENNVKTKLSQLETDVAVVDVTVTENNTAVLLTANQVINVSNDGTVNYSYWIDSARKNFFPKQIMQSGANTFTHILSTDPLAKGTHNLTIKMSSDDMVGITDAGDVHGAVSGYIEEIHIVEPLNYNLRFHLSTVSTGQSVELPLFTSTSKDNDVIVDWGDGTTEKYDGVNNKKSHIYTKDISLCVVEVTIKTTALSNNATGYGLWTQNLYKIDFPDNLITLSVNLNDEKQSSLIEQVNLGASLQNISGTWNLTKLSYISFPETLLSMDASINLPNLKSVTTPESTNVTGNFKDCTSLVSATIKGGAVLGSQCFSDCSALSNVKLADSIEALRNYSFSNCKALYNINLPHNLITIYDYAFYNSGVKSIVVPASVTSIRPNAFSDCATLSSFSFENGSQLRSFVTQNVFNRCYMLKEITFPASLQKINGGYIGAYTHSSIGNGIEIVNFESGSELIEIGVWAFYNCTTLREVNITSNLLTSVAGFYGCTNLSKVNLPSTIKTISGFNDCTSLKTIELPAELTLINTAAFINSGLTEIIIPNKVLQIGQQAFSGCKNLSNVILPEGLTSIGSQCFYDCTNLPSIIIPNSVKNIDYLAFSGCTNLVNVIIGDGVTKIGEQVFLKCKNLIEINVSQGNSNYETFGGALFTKELKELVACPAGIWGVFTIPEDTETIQTYALAECVNLLEIDIRGSINTVGSYAFLGCNKITEIKLPNSIETLGIHSFENCSSLESVNIPTAIDTIRGHTFNKCYKLHEIVIPSNVKTIQDYAFGECGLTKITIEHGVSVIGGNAFYHVNLNGSKPIDIFMESYAKDEITGAPWGAYKVTIHYADGDVYYAR